MYCFIMELAKSKTTTVHTNATPTLSLPHHQVPQTSLTSLLLHHHGRHHVIKLRPSWANNKTHFPNHPPNSRELPSATLSSTSSNLQRHGAMQSCLCQIQVPLWLVKARCDIPGPVARCCEQASGCLLWTRARIDSSGFVSLGRVRWVVWTRWWCLWIIGLLSVFYFVGIWWNVRTRTDGLTRSSGSELLGLSCWTQWRSVRLVLGFYLRYVRTWRAGFCLFAEKYG